MAERLKAPVLKTGRDESPSWVRIPPPRHTVYTIYLHIGDEGKSARDAMGIRDRPTAPRSPWQNGYVERLIGSIRRESLDHLVMFGEAHLHHVLKAYASYYNKVRPHRRDTDPRRAPSSIRPSLSFRQAHALGNNPIALRHLRFEANLHFVSSDDLQGQFAANRLELALGGLEPADLIRWAEASAGFCGCQ